MTTREQKLKVIRNWMSYFHLSLDDLDLDVDSLEALDDAQLDFLLEDVEEDRARHAAEGVVISPDFTEITGFQH